MTTRTIQILGLAYGAEPANITATVNGATVFSGTVTTANEAVPSLPNFDLIPDQVVFFSFERDSALDNNITMTYTVNSGTAIFGDVLSDNVQIPNPVYTQMQLDQLANPATTRAERNAIYQTVANPPLSEADLEVLSDPAVPQATKNALVAEHNCAAYIDSGNTMAKLTNDPRSNVSIDGQSITFTRDLEGTWWWQVNSGSTLSCDFTVASVA